MHILNRSLTLVVKNMTTEEAWSEHKPAVDHFIIFGSLAYAHILDQKISKLDDKGVKCVLLGVSEESKAYRLYNPKTQKIIISRDVVINEDNNWDWSSTRDESILVDVDTNDENKSDKEALTTGETSTNVPTSNESTEDQPSSSDDQQRQRKRPFWMTDYISGDELSNDDTIAYFVHPLTFNDTVKKIKWRKAVDVEIAAIEKNDTWQLTDLPEGEKSIRVKWIYKTRLNEKGEVDKYKARLVAKGYTEVYGVDYLEVFAPVARHDTI